MSSAKIQDYSEFSKKKCPKKRKYLRWAMKVLALAVESTCDGHRKYFHFFTMFFGD